MAPPQSPSVGQQCRRNEDTDLSKNQFADILQQDTEVADPDRSEVNEYARRHTPIVPLDTKRQALPKFLTQCGCGNCPQRVDPIADEITQSGKTPFGDLQDRRDYLAKSDCPNPVPMPVCRAAKATRIHLTTYYNDDGSGDPLSRCEQSHAELLDAERDLLERWDSDVSTALLSLRFPPVEEPDPIEGESVEKPDYDCIDHKSSTTSESEQHQPLGSDERRWVAPTRLVERHRDRWQKVRKKVNYELGKTFDQWGYLWVFATTDSMATPHRHVLIWVKDPQNQLSVDHVRPVVKKFVETTPTARRDHHPVKAGDNDAAVVQTDPTKSHSVPDETLIQAMKRRECTDTGMKRNTAALHYLLNQRPPWVIRQLIDGTADPQDRETQIDLAGLAIQWASNGQWYGTGGVFNSG